MPGRTSQAQAALSKCHRLSIRLDRILGAYWEHSGSAPSPGDKGDCLGEWEVGSTVVPAAEGRQSAPGSTTCPTVRGGWPSVSQAVSWGRLRLMWWDCSWTRWVRGAPCSTSVSIASPAPCATTIIGGQLIQMCISSPPTV